MSTPTVHQRMERSQHLRGMIAACETRMKELHKELGRNNEGICEQMRRDLREKYGRDYAPRITFYSSDHARAIPYLVKLGEVDELKVTAILVKYLPTINGTPAIQSLLYDLNMLPEQTVTVEGAIQVAAICEAFLAAKADQ